MFAEVGGSLRLGAAIGGVVPALIGEIARSAAAGRDVRPHLKGPVCQSVESLVGRRIEEVRGGCRRSPTSSGGKTSISTREPNL